MRSTKVFYCLPILFLGVIALAGCPGKSNPAAPAAPAPTDTFTAVSSPTPTGTATPTPSSTVTATPTDSGTPSPSGTPTPTPTLTATSTVTDSPTLTPSPTPSGTPTLTATSTPTSKPSVTATPTPSGTPTSTPTATDTAVYPYVQSFGHDDIDPYSEYIAVAGTSSVTVFVVDAQAQRLDTYTGSVPGGFSAVNFVSPSVNMDGIAWDPSAGNFVVAVGNSAGNAYVRRFTPAGGNPGGGGPVTFGTAVSSPAGLALDASGNIYMADPNANEIRVYGPSGSAVTSFGGYNLPDGVAVDQAHSLLYVGDRGDDSIIQSALDGSAPVTYSFPYVTNLAVDAQGNVFVPDYFNNRVVKYGYGWSNPVTFGQANLSNAKPMGLAVDGGGYVYVIDDNNYLGVIQFAPH